MTQQQQVVISWLVNTLAVAAVSKGLIPQAWADWIGSPETLVFIGSAFSFGMLAWRYWQTRPKAVVASAANLPQVQAVIAAPAIAGSKATPANVVPSLEAAKAVPGVPAQ